MIFFISLHLLWFRKKALKMENLGVYLPLKNFGDYFQQGVYTHLQEISSWKKYERSGLSKALKIFLLHPTVFALEKWSQKRNIQFFSSRKQPLVATLSKTSTLIPERYLAEQGIDIPNNSETLKLFWLHSLIFDLE